ncbi:MAG: Blp family class II bacteriocin [Clostridia bacterium]|nr:Blp family class II bacteriocin [Clostridia bacterium]
MMTNERRETLQKQFAEILEREGFMESLGKCVTTKDVCELLSANGIAITSEEVVELTEQGNEALKEYSEKAHDELDEEDLTDVTGGSKFWRGFAAIAGGAVLGAAAGFVCGMCPGAAPVCYKVILGYSIASGVWVNAG